MFWWKYLLQLATQYNELTDAAEPQIHILQLRRKGKDVVKMSLIISQSGIEVKRI
jgi:hypothetical protein